MLSPQTMFTTSHTGVFAAKLLNTIVLDVCFQNASQRYNRILLTTTYRRYDIEFAERKKNRKEEKENKPESNE